jgi:hypothetical protein
MRATLLQPWCVWAAMGAFLWVWIGCSPTGSPLAACHGLPPDEADAVLVIYACNLSAPNIQLSGPCDWSDGGTLVIEGTGTGNCVVDMDFPGGPRVAAMVPFTERTYCAPAYPVDYFMSPVHAIVVGDVPACTTTPSCACLSGVSCGNGALCFDTIPLVDGGGDAGGGVSVDGASVDDN